ncbi:MAG: thioredoxin-disulfide reductase [Chloroflexi bacterium]|nr:thioredoxin-disulfide reductase [Chloroflexota bacterium]
MPEPGGNEYEVIIIGGGPAGLSAGIYACRSRLNAVLLERSAVGGQIVNADKVENYPGFAEGISGFELVQQMEKQAARFGLKVVTTDVSRIAADGGRKALRTSDGDYAARAVIIAGGSERQKLGVPGEEKYTGRGVSYCATCDAAFFNDQTVAVVGGGNAALTEALQLAKFASKVIVIHRRDQLRATRIVQERAQADPKISFILNTVVDEIEGDEFCRGVRLHNLVTGEASRLDVSGVFVAIGFKPNTAFVKGVLALDDIGSIMVNDRLETSVPGIFAAGDIRHNSIRQVIGAAADGAMAAMSAERYLSE